MSGFYNRSATIHKLSPAPSLRNRRSMTFCSLGVETKKKENKTLDDIQQEIIRNHQSINGIIVRFREVVSERLQAQQLQLLLVFKNTVDKMMSEIQEIVATYRQAVEEVKLSSSVSKLQNQLSYFKTQALQLFEINQNYKKEVIDLKKTIFDLKIDKQANSKVIQKLTKKVMKNKIRQKSLFTEQSGTIDNQLPFITQDSCVKSPTLRTGRRRTLGSSFSKVS